MQFENFSIRALNESDLQSFYDLIDQNRARLEAFFAGTVSRTRTFSEAEIYLQEILSKADNKTYLPFIIIDNTTQAFVGFLDLKNIDWNIPKGELGCFVDKILAGKGLSKKAFALFTDYCFKELGFNKLFLRTHESNTAACRLAESCGFEIEGKIRRDYKTSEGELIDLLYYGKLAESQAQPFKRAQK